MRVVSCLSQKGGVGKTTIAINLAVCAAHDCKSVLLLDRDPQQSVARCHSCVREKDLSLRRKIYGLAGACWYRADPDLSGQSLEERIQRRLQRHATLGLAER
ncbi:MAG: AAA family ATPase [Pseudomonadota bacterium]